MQKAEAYTIVLSGSFRKHFSQVLEKISTFEKEGFLVASPKASAITNPGEDFVRLETDPKVSAKELEQKHLNAISHGDALYIVNATGYLGTSTALEIGWALALCKPIFCQEPFQEGLFRDFARVAVTPEEVRRHLVQREQLSIENVSERSSLAVLQDYVELMVKKRGFKDESPRDIMLLMLEEVGELARAVRKHSGLKMDQARTHKLNVEEELADIFIYLLDLANVCQVDLFEAFKRKELQNSQRLWTVGP